MECLSCKSISGERRISPGPTIYEGSFWLVEHAYPCGLVGWLVVVLKRHAEALHELSEAECAELGEIQGRTAKLLFRETGCEKEYSICLAEAEGFHHVHCHMVAKPHNLPDHIKGANVFGLLKVREDEAPWEQIVAFCEKMKQEFDS